jgi:hypothetical protein
MGGGENIVTGRYTFRLGELMKGRKVVSPRMCSYTCREAPAKPLDLFQMVVGVNDADYVLVGSRF